MYILVKVEGHIFIVSSSITINIILEVRMQDLG